MILVTETNISTAIQSLLEIQSTKIINFCYYFFLKLAKIIKIWSGKWDMWQNLMSSPISTGLFIVIAFLTIDFVTCLTDKYRLKPPVVQGERPRPGTSAAAAPPSQRLWARWRCRRVRWWGCCSCWSGRGRCCWGARMWCRSRRCFLDGGFFSCTAGDLLPGSCLVLASQLDQFELKLKFSNFSSAFV